MFQLIKMLLSSLTQADKEGIYASPVLLAAIDEVHAADASDEAYTRFWWEVTYFGSPLQGMALLKDAAFIYSVEQALGAEQVAIWNACNKGSIWQFVGVQQHAMVGDTLRPVFTLEK
jgi:hypothetical protein